MEETTFYSVKQADGSDYFYDTHSWLGALYSEASLKKFDTTPLYHIISCQISFEKIERQLGYIFKDKNILIQALIQSTFCHEIKGEKLPSNERLEFLGDSLVNLIVGKNLYMRYQNNAEGDLSKLRGALVNEEKLAELARILGLGDYIFLGKGEFKSGGSAKDSILADTFEALFAAIYFDSQGDMGMLEKIFSNIVEKFAEQNQKDFYSLEQLEIFDTKSKLQEMVVARHGVFPIYKAREIADASFQGFLVELWIGERKVGEMQGTSKKKVEKLLAKRIIEEKLY